MQTESTGIVRGPVSAPAVEPASKLIDPKTVGTTKTESFIAFSHERGGVPYTANKYGVKEIWGEADNGGFTREVSGIERYLTDQIKNGLLADTTAEVDARLKEIEKLSGANKVAKPALKLGTIAAFVQFLGTKDDLFAEHRKYA